MAHSLYEFCFAPVTVVNASDGHAGAIAVSPSALENAAAALLTMSVGFVRHCELNTCIVAGFSEASTVNTATVC